MAFSCFRLFLFKDRHLYIIKNKREVPPNQIKLFNSWWEVKQPWRREDAIEEREKMNLFSSTTHDCILAVRQRRRRRWKMTAVLSAHRLCSDLKSAAKRKKRQMCRNEWQETRAGLRLSAPSCHRSCTYYKTKESPSQCQMKCLLKKNVCPYPSGKESVWTEEAKPMFWGEFAKYQIQTDQSGLPHGELRFCTAVFN